MPGLGPEVTREHDGGWLCLPEAVALLEDCGWTVRSCIDVGAGAGAWLAAAHKLGIVDTVAVEGAWVRKIETRIPKEQYVFTDFHDESLDFTRRFDLALCLEVAEHLPPPKAERIVETLARLSDVVLFSAAIPHQGGTHHANEQWPSYWAALFAARGFRCFDVLRWSIWDDERIAYWYRQNVLLYVRRETVELCQSLNLLPYRAFMPERPAGYVHPRGYESLVAYSQCPPVRVLLRALPKALRRALEWRLHRLLGMTRRLIDS
ncbi:MAG: methyltransferase domain-containing protein [Planctomycetota bacterium]